MFGLNSILTLITIFPYFRCDDSLFMTNEASSNKDIFQIWAVVLCCVGFCILIKHLNDFFTGGTKTLVEEGLWGGRFKHRKDYRNLQHVEKDFAAMYYEMTKANKNMFEIRNRDILEEVETDTDDLSDNDENKSSRSQTVSCQETQSTKSTDTKSE